MSDAIPPVNSLVLYKKRPARVLENTGRLEIEPESGGSIKVRPKDILMIHPGPCQDLHQLLKIEGDVELAWQMLVEAGSPLPFPELCELIYGVYTPQAAWAAWELVEDGLYFSGDPTQIKARSPEAVGKERQLRKAKIEEAQDWSEFIQRAREGKVDLETDVRYLRETEDLANGRRNDSRLLRELGRSERPATAQSALLSWGYWDALKNPYPTRLGVSISPSFAAWPAPSSEHRVDLMDLAAFAIDDRENQDPDDAISLISCQFDGSGRLTGARLWVHVADPASSAVADSELDLEARLRGATFYSPEGTVPMLPPAAIEQLALGLQEVSPALSFELELGPTLEPRLLNIQPSFVRVQRLSYEDAEGLLDQEPFCSLLRIAQAFENRRLESGALSIDLPEALIRVQEGKVSIRPLLRLKSRDMVREAMLIAGEAAGRFAVEQGIPFPYAVQESPDFPATFPANLRPPAGLSALSGRFAIRRFMKRSQTSSHPSPHAGLGLPFYTRLTSPLRRYHDLIAHQQLRRFLQGERPLDEQALLRHIGAAEEPILRIAQAESLSRRHWTLVYLLQNPGWQGEAILLDKEGLRGQVVFPDLAYENFVHLRNDLPLDTHLQLHLHSVNLPELEAKFSILSETI